MYVRTKRDIDLIVFNPLPTRIQVPDLTDSIENRPLTQSNLDAIHPCDPVILTRRDFYTPEGAKSASSHQREKESESREKQLRRLRNLCSSYACSRRSRIIIAESSLWLFLISLTHFCPLQVSYSKKNEIV